VRFAKCFGQLIHLQVMPLCMDYVRVNYQHKVLEKDTVYNFFLHKRVVKSKNKRGYVIELLRVAVSSTQDLFL
jgi:hypothetical protein